MLGIPPKKIFLLFINQTLLKMKYMTQNYVIISICNKKSALWFKKFLRLKCIVLKCLNPKFQLLNFRKWWFYESLKPWHPVLWGYQLRQPARQHYCHKQRQNDLLIRLKDRKAKLHLQIRWDGYYGKMILLSQMGRVIRQNHTSESDRKNT